MCEPLAEPNLASVTAHIAKHWPSDFCWSSCFEPSFLAALMHEGYLPTAHGPVDGPVEYILLPKLHQERCIVLFDDLKVSRSARSKSHNYQLSVDTAFDEVVEKCLVQHGESWLHPPIIDSFKHLFRSGGTGQVKMHSIEVTHEGKLVAGELGYSVGKTYCSLSGFTAKGGSGSVQCLGLALLLHERGFDFWDLGMGMEYKLKMGARQVSRADFLQMLRASRDLVCNQLSLKATNASCFLVPRFRIGSYVRVRTPHGKVGRLADLQVGVVTGHCGVHFKVRLHDSTDTKECIILPVQQLDDVCTEDVAQRREHTREDGSVVISGLPGLPLLVRRAPGWTRCRRAPGKRGAGASKKTRVGDDKTAGTGSDADMQEAATPSCAQADHDAQHLSLGAGNGQQRHAAGGGSDRTAATVRPVDQTTGQESDDARWNRRKGHHIQWNAGALRRRQMRLVLFQLLTKREEAQNLSKRAARTLKKLRINSARQDMKGGEGGVVRLGLCS